MLYHVTLASNLSSIIQERRLESAAALTARTSGRERGDGSTDVLRTVREQTHRLAPGKTLNDQRPLRGWRKPGLSDYVELLNQHVFFWQWSPIDRYSNNQKKNYPALRHASLYGARYLPCAGQWDRVLLRARRIDLEDLNAATGPRFSICNSGSPDRNADLRVLRSKVFSAPREAAVEVVFNGFTLLPASTEVWNRKRDRWDLLEHCGPLDELVAPAAIGHMTKVP